MILLMSHKLTIITEQLIILNKNCTFIYQISNEKDMQVLVLKVKKNTKTKAPKLI